VEGEVLCLGDSMTSVLDLDPNILRLRKHWQPNHTGQSTNLPHNSRNFDSHLTSCGGVLEGIVDNVSECLSQLDEVDEDKQRAVDWLEMKCHSSVLCLWRMREREREAETEGDREVKEANL
jgi:hypothetical protein